MKLSNYTPGIVASYDAEAKQVRVKIPGLTDNAEKFPEAEICYPIGDNGQNTDIRILAGDPVWLAFTNGDPRYPIIVGFRNINVSNETAWRRFFHQNIELDADEEILLQAGTDIDLQAGSDINATAATDVNITATGGKVKVTAGTEVDVIAPTKISFTVGEVSFVMTAAGFQMVGPLLDASGIPLANFGGPVNIAGLMTSVGFASGAPAGGGAAPGGTIAGPIKQTGGDFTTEGDVKSGPTGGPYISLTEHPHTSAPPGDPTSTPLPTP